MKQVKKIMVLAFAVIMIMAMNVTAFAAKEVNVGTGEGSIELENGTTGETYKLFKIFDATYSGTNVSYTITESSSPDNSGFIDALKKEDSPFTLTMISDSDPSKYNVVRKTSVSDEELLKWVKEKVEVNTNLQVGEAITLEEKDGQAIQWTNLAYGYYLVTSTLGEGAVTIDSNVPDAHIIDKNQSPSFNKNIVDDPQNPVKVNEAGLNEDIKFEIKTQAKNYDGEEKIFKYVIYDTLDNGFSFNDDIIVKVNNEKKDAVTDYTIVYKDKDDNIINSLTSEVQKFEITINWTNDGTKYGDHMYAANSEIVVTYSAKLDPAKASEVKVGAVANNNEADVKYYKDDDEADKPSGDLPDQTTKTYTTQITINKVDGNDKALAGAEFKLTTGDGTKVTFTSGTDYTEATDGTYYKLKDGSYTEDAPNGNAEHDAEYEDTTKTYKKIAVYTAMGDSQTIPEMKAFVKDDGTLTFSGLGIGTYKIEETTVPNGYNKADDIVFTISFNADTKTFSTDNTSVTLDSANNVFETKIVNKAGSLLPSTGGMGTTMFYLIGGVLVVAAAVLLVTKRRMRGEE